MTLKQFCEMARDSGLVVRCSTVYERRNVLELFEEAGFPISSVSSRHLLVEAGEDDDDEYMHPGYDANKGYTSCFRSFDIATQCQTRHGVSYDDVRNLIEDPLPIDNRNDAEFAEDFAALFCTERSQHGR